MHIYIYIHYNICVSVYTYLNLICETIYSDIVCLGPFLVLDGYTFGHHPSIPLTQASLPKGEAVTKSCCALAIGSDKGHPFLLSRNGWYRWFIIWLVVTGT